MIIVDYKVSKQLKIEIIFFSLMDTPKHKDSKVTGTIEALLGYRELALPVMTLKVEKADGEIKKLIGFTVEVYLWKEEEYRSLQKGNRIELIITEKAFSPHPKRGVESYYIGIISPFYNGK